MITIYKGDTPTWTFTLTYSSDNSAVDLTGSAVHFICKNGSTEIFDLTCTLDDDPTTGICTAIPTATETATAGQYPVELSVRWTTGPVLLTALKDDLEIKNTFHTWS